MRFLAAFTKTMIATQVAAIGGLLFTGWVLTLVQCERFDGTFFTYRIIHLDHTPAWFAASLVLSAINGFWLFKLAVLEGAVGTPLQGPWGAYNATVPLNPLRLFAINLVAIPALIGIFIMIRSMSF